MTLTDNERKVAIERNVNKVFASARYFEDLIKVFNEDFFKYQICIPLDVYRGNPFFVVTGIDSEHEKKYKFTLIGDAFKFALDEYTTAVRLEALNAVTGNAYELIEEAIE